LNRRVELVGDVPAEGLGFGGPGGVDPCPQAAPDMASARAQGSAAEAEGAAHAPAITEWTGSGGQEWLPFSVLMATGDGAAGGWEGTRIDMPPGSQPQACQALCLSEARCAAFSFEPAGSYFVEHARCALVGGGTQLNLARQNAYYDGGTYFATGLRPDARLLTPESEEVAQQILADLAEIAALRVSARITAPTEHAPESWMDIAIDGGVPAGRYQSYLNIAELDDYEFDWMKSRSSVFVHELADGRSGQIWVPQPGDYTLRYVIEHPTAGTHTIAEQAFSVRAEGATASAGAPASPEAATPVPVDAGGATLTFPDVVAPGAVITVSFTGPRHSGDWIDIVTAGNDSDFSGGWAWSWATGDSVTLPAPGEPGSYTLRYVAEVPDLGRRVLAEGPLRVTADAPVTLEDEASLSFPMVVAPGEAVPVRFTGPRAPGDWIDIITAGNDADFSGGWAWAWAAGDSVMLTAPSAPGEYSLRYVAEVPGQGPRVISQDALVVRMAGAGGAAMDAVTAEALAHRCTSPTAGTGCEISDPATGHMFTLMSGYGATEPFFMETAAGIRADVPSFDLVRLGDGLVVAAVNPPRAGEPCLPALAGLICLVGDPSDSANIMAAFMLAGSLVPAGMADPAHGPDKPETAEAEHLDGANMAGVWWLRSEEPGTPAYMEQIAVITIDADFGVQGFSGDFLFHPTYPPFAGQRGRVSGMRQGDDLTLVLGAAAGELRIEGSFFGDISVPARVVPTGEAVLLSRVAGPGESWDGPPWMFGRPDGMAAAMEMGRNLLGDVLAGSGDAPGLGLPAEGGAMMEALLRGLSGGAQTSAPAPAARSPQMQAEDTPGPEGVSASALTTILAPHLLED
jgi:hypothetical protein